MSPLHRVPVLAWSARLSSIPLCTCSISRLHFCSLFRCPSPTLCVRLPSSQFRCQRRVCPLTPCPPQFIHFTRPDAPRKLHGRFIQITDMHPDPYYKAHKSLDNACHRKKPKKKKDRADFWGTAYSYGFLNACRHVLHASRECDSPLRLTNYTLDFLDKHWSSEIDFVVCQCAISVSVSLSLIYCRDRRQCEVGHTFLPNSSSKTRQRHDNDHQVPRTPAEIFDLNRAVAKKMDKIFASKGIPVVPSLGTVLILLEDPV